MVFDVVMRGEGIRDVRDRTEEISSAPGVQVFVEWHSPAAAATRAINYSTALQRIATTLFSPPLPIDALTGYPIDPTAYILASRIKVTYPGDLITHDEILGVLDVHRWIRRWKPRKQRLCIHAGDWDQYLQLMDRAAASGIEEKHMTALLAARAKRTKAYYGSTTESEE